MTHWKVL